MTETFYKSVHKNLQQGKPREYKQQKTEVLIMKKIAKLLVIAVLFVMCFMNIACMGCGTETPVEPNTSEVVPSENGSEPASNQVNTSENATDEESAYRAWKDIEVSKPAFGETGANIGAGELLERAVTVEEFINKYPNSSYRDEAVEHYNALVTAAITGGYAEGENNNHLYLDDNGETFSADVVTDYDTFVNNYGDTRTADIVREYTTVIGNADGSFTEDVKLFYVDLVERLKNLFSMDGINEGMNGGSAGGNMNENGNGGTQNNTQSGTQGKIGGQNNSGQSVQ